MIIKDWEPVFTLGSFYWVNEEGEIIRPMTSEEMNEIFGEMEIDEVENDLG